jgi:hypothetical protein
VITPKYELVFEYYKYLTTLLDCIIFDSKIVCVYKLQ